MSESPKFNSLRPAITPESVLSQSAILQTEEAEEHTAKLPSVFADSELHLTCIPNADGLGYAATLNAMSSQEKTNK